MQASRTVRLSLWLTLALAAAACGGGQGALHDATQPAPSQSAVAVAPPAPEPSGVPEGWHREQSPALGKAGMVSSDEARATRAGVAMLQAGGSAADAAVATAFALAVTFPTAGNLGGGGFAVVDFAGQAKALDFRETAPAAASRDMFLGADGKPSDDAYKSIRSVGVPGSVAGLWELHRAHGKLSWAKVLEPALALARGFEVDQAFVGTIERAKDKLATHPTSAALYLPGGAPPALGSTFENPKLLASLQRIAKGGPKGFYEGETARAIVAQMKADKGLISLADLKGYKALWRTPIEFDYRGHRVVSMPPPSAGGVTLAMMARMLEADDLSALGFQSYSAQHLTFEVMRRAFAARNTRLGDPDFVSMPLDQLLSPGWAKAQRASIQPQRATPSADVPTGGAASGAGPHTTHFSVVDGAGNAVALTTTVNHWFGNGITVKDGGFVLNNEMDDFAAVPGEANAFGLVQGEANAIAPGKRMLSSMSPTIVYDAQNKPKLVIGGAGGPTIITTVFQQLSAVLDFEKPFADAVSAPRFHMQHLPDVVMYEERGLRSDLREALEKNGYELKERPYIADAPGIAREGDRWVGVAEPRRAGGLAEGL